HLASGWRLAGAHESEGDQKRDPGQQLLHALTVEHPLQPFSAKYFRESPEFFSFAREWQVLHETVTEKGEVKALQKHQQEEPLSLMQLQDFLRNPVKHFFSQRLKIF